MCNYEESLKYIDEHTEKITSIAKSIWEHPEIAFQEFHASQLLAEELEQAGFSIEMGVGDDMPTAFIASWGDRTPIIGILAEYDALPGLSQKVSATQEPVKTGAPGHGCGHNLFGAGCFGTAIAVKDNMEKNGIKGTLRFYGCPAEETLAGKVFMAREGVFDDLDAAITWHPGYTNSVQGGEPGMTAALAMNSFKVKFTGRSSHAAAAPQMGRSALKAVQLMDVGVNYMREHITTESRVHCVITDGGGAPNVVPSNAEIWYYIRAPKREMVESIYAWVLNIAEGAALMTGTKHEVEFLTGCHELLPNSVISNIMIDKMRSVGDLNFSEEDYAFAKDLQANIPPEFIQMSTHMMLQMAAPGTTVEEIGTLLCEKVIAPADKIDSSTMAGSTDVAEVSHITPTGNLMTCTAPLGTPPHSWQEVSASGSEIGIKGAVFAAKAMALTALELFTNPEVLSIAQEEFKKFTDSKGYVSPLPEGVKPK